MNVSDHHNLRERIVFQIKTFYLIDYENVHDSGFKGSGQLTGKEHVHIFSSANAPYVNISSLSSLKGKFYFHKVPAGKESLDMNLVSFLGYLIHKNKGKKVIYIIISQDRGYDKVIQYWKEEKGVVIARGSCFEIEINSKEKQPNCPNKKMKVNLDVQQVLAKEKVKGEFVNGVASIVSKNYKMTNRKQVIYLTLLSRYGKQDGLHLYNLIKHLL